MYGCMDGQTDGWGEGCKKRGMGREMDSQTITKMRPQPAPQIQGVGWTLSPRATGQEERP